PRTVRTTRVAAARLHPASRVHPAVARIRGAQLSAAAGLSELSAARQHAADGVSVARWGATGLPAAALPRPARLRRAVPASAAILGAPIRHPARWRLPPAAAGLRSAAHRPSVARLFG